MFHQLIDEGIGVVIKLSGSVNGEDLFLLNQQLIEHENFPNWRYKIWDFTRIDEAEISVDQVRAFAFQSSMVRSTNPDHRVAIIPRKGLKGSGLDAVFHLMSEEWGGFRSRSFPSVNAARKWVR